MKDKKSHEEQFSTVLTMSDYSGYSSASRLELAQKDKAMKNMAAQMASMHAILVANGLVSNTATGALSQPSASSFTTSTNLDTPSRKRHLSQQLAPKAKDIRVAGTSGLNRFEVLTQAESYSDQSMKPDSVSGSGFTRVKPRGNRAKTVAKRTNTTNPSSPSEQMQVEDEIVDVTNRSDLVESVIPNQVEPLFGVNNEGPFRQEIEVGIATLNGNKFFGSITHAEAKFLIFRDCLGFGDCSNFDGVRHSYKGMPVLTFKLKTAINIDELMDIQHFEFLRKSTRQGVPHVDTIGCKIRGLRSHQNMDSSNVGTSNHIDDGSRVIRIEGCEYRIPEKSIIEFFSQYGVITSKIVEELFEAGISQDPDNDGTNRTGTYAFRIRLEKDIPQFVPILGKRIKVNYPGIPRLCTNCFRAHDKKNCQSKKITWQEYARTYAKLNSSFPSNLFAKWMVDTKPTSPIPQTSNDEPFVEAVTEPMNIEPHVPTRPVMVNQVNKQADKTGSSTHPTTRNMAIREAPAREVFGIPTTKKEHYEIVLKLVLAGSSEAEAESIIASRKAAFNKANREHKKQSNPNQTNSVKKQPKQVLHVTPSQNSTKHD